MILRSLRALTLIFGIAIFSLAPSYGQKDKLTPVEAEVDTLAVMEAKVDTLAVMEAEHIRQHRCKRGLMEKVNVFVPRGQWIVGGTGSFSEHANDNYNLLIVEGIDSRGYTINVSPIVAYAVADNIALGARFEYGRTFSRIENAALEFGDDETGVSLSIDDYYVLQNSYSGMFIWRQYLPLGHSKRFALFSEVQLEAGGTRSKLAFDDPIKGTYTNGYNVGLNVVPGLVAFATNDVAFEVTIGVLGLSYSHNDQIHNQVYQGSVDTSVMNFSINIFSIGLGVAFYL